MSTIAWAVIALIVGGAIGAAAVWMFGVRRAGPMSVREMKKENERFREEVNAHFVQSAELINELTDSYKRVFDHLSDGAERLVDPEAMRGRMPQVERAEVRLRHIGAPKDYPSSGKASSGKTPSAKTSSDKVPSDRTPPEKTSSGKTSSDKTSSDKPSSDKTSFGKASSGRTAEHAGSKSSAKEAPKGEKSP